VRIWEIVKQEPARRIPRQVGYLLEPNSALLRSLQLEMTLIFADAGQKVWVAPMAMAGLDAPVTLAGTLVMQNAYNLAGIALAWALGIKGYWAGTAHTLDMRSSLCSFGSPNQALIAISAIQLGSFYGFEVEVNSALTDACVPDFQGGFEKGMTGAVAMLAGAGCIGAQGIVGADQGASLEQIVIDDEWASALDHVFSLGVEVSKDTLGVEAIQRVGVGGSFITDEHTLRHMRKTYWRASIFNQMSWDSWKAAGGKDVYEHAHEKSDPSSRSTIHRSL
jgi:trimethylamine--corrinoid protein Co-methyltransferase